MPSRPIAASRPQTRPVWYAGRDSVLGELWTMVHPPYTVMVLSFVVTGAAMSPRFSTPVLVATLVAYFLGLGIGAHFLDQITGMGSRYVRHWSDRALWAWGNAALASGAAAGKLRKAVDDPALTAATMTDRSRFAGELPDPTHAAAVRVRTASKAKVRAAMVPRCVS